MKYTLEMLKNAKPETMKRLGVIPFFSHKPTPKISETCLSQWFMRSMVIDGVKYNCCEQYMMSEKAKLFEDQKSYDAIMKMTKQFEMKAQGRKVKNFDKKIWEKYAPEIVFKANMAKFSQHEDLKQFLLSTGNKILVETNPDDKIWGVALSTNFPFLDEVSYWKGTNYLGFILMEVRDNLRK